MTSVVGRSGGIYIPPFKLARLKEEITDPLGSDAQRIEWERLRKSIKGLVNRVSPANIKLIVQELFVENLIRGRGLFVRSVMHAQIASPLFTNVLAALVAVINTKIPDIGDLLLRRLVLQFRRAYMRSDEILLSSICKFFAHLVNQRVISEMIVLQVVTIFLEKLSSDSVKLCCQMLFECGATLSVVCPKGVFFIFERLRQVLQEGGIDKRVQYTIEGLFETRRKQFASHPAIHPDLDLVEEADQVTHDIDVIEGDVDGEEALNLFSAKDAGTYQEENTNWQATSAEILGISSDHEGDESEFEAADEGVEDAIEQAREAATTVIADMTEQDMINLRKTIYLAIMSSANFEECVHKILSLNIRNGQEKEVVNMLIDCAAMEKTSNRFFHLQGERLCRLSRVYRDGFQVAFPEQYESMHRYETGKIRNIAKFFSHLLFTDAIDWMVLSYITLTESETTSSTRIFIKILFQDLAENMTAARLNERVVDEKYAPALAGIFPTEDLAHIRFSINFFTAIGLGQLTSEQRQRLNELSIRAALEAKEKEEIKRSPSRSRDRHHHSRSRSASRDHRRKRSRSHSSRRRRRSRSSSRDSFGRVRRERYREDHHDNRRHRR